MVNRYSIANKLSAVKEQISEIETLVQGIQEERTHEPDRGSRIRHYCAMPLMPEREFGPDVSPERASLIRNISKKWVNGTNLHYYFFDDRRFGAPEQQKTVVREGFKAWSDVGIGLTFREVQDISDAEIRIGFLQGDGAWSYVGRDVLEIGISERTMNFGWDLTQPGEVDTAIHEIGHTLGFPHEHQNPNAGIVWDEPAVYAALAQPPNNWSREQTFSNIIRKIAPDTVDGSNWDPNSVMHYPFGAGLIQSPAQYRASGINPNPGLSDKDRQQVKFFYPPLDPSLPALQELKSQLLSIGPGEQRNFSFTPTATRTYTFRTFGDSDTVMVLFEEIDGELRFVDGDDDSGTDTNASIQVRLIKGKTYVLRIRLYYSFASGDTAVMVW